MTRREELTADLAQRFANLRSKGNVYMSGSHNPQPTEKQEAKRFMESLDYVGLLMDPANSSTASAYVIELEDHILRYVQFDDDGSHGLCRYCVNYLTNGVGHEITCIVLRVEARRRVA